MKFVLAGLVLAALFGWLLYVASKAERHTFFSVARKAAVPVVIAAALTAAFVMLSLNTSIKVF
jgi:hypothetical protein